MIYPWGNSRRFHSLADHYKQKYGSRIQKVSVNAGFTCPNRDGTIGIGGCSFCNNSGFSPSYCHDAGTIHEQIEIGLKFLKKRYRRAQIFVAYFQSYSNTYDHIDNLKRLYGEALAHPGISGLSIGTRPDCIDEEKLQFLAEIAEQKIVSIEYGVESCYEETLMKINRGHTFRQSADAIELTSRYGLHTGIHLIIGLPGESREQILKQSEIISQLPVNSIKFHQLQIVSNTRMADEFLANPENFDFFEPEEYVDFMVKFIENLRPDIAIERFAGEVPPEFNLRRSWNGLRSDQVIMLIEKKLEELDTWQGKKFRT